MVNELITKRFSPRAFSERTIDSSIINDLFEAARWAPSSRNEQPWRFIEVTRDDQESFDRMLSVMNESNRIWAENAPLLVLAAAKTDHEFNGYPNRYAFYDTSHAVANFTMQAMTEDIYVHQIGGFNAELARTLFELPDNFEPVIILAAGYRGDVSSLPEHLQVRELAQRRRKELSEIVYSGKFARPAMFLNEEETAG